MKSGFILLLIAGICGALSATPKNSDFELGKRWQTHTIPQDWGVGFKQKATGTIELDTKNVKHGKKSLKITNSNGIGYINIISQKTVIPANAKQPLISIDIATENAGEAKVVLLAYDKSGKNVLWKSLFWARGTKPWKRYSRRIVIPPAAVTYQLSLRLKKAGSVWYDNLDVDFTGKPKTATTVDLINGTLEKLDSNGMPKGWTEFHFTGIETVGNVTTDNSSRNGKNSLKVSWKSGATGFGVAYTINNMTKQSYRFSAWGKTDRRGKLQVMALAYDKQGDIIMSAQSNELASSGKWSQLTTTFAVPRKAVSLQLLCLSADTGVVWYDDMKLLPIAKAQIKAAYPISFSSEPATGNALWNNWRPVFATFTNSPCSLTFDFWGDKSKLENPAFVIELPAEITVAECFNSHGNVINPAMEPELIDFTRDGKPWTRYIYNNPKAIAMIKARPAFWRSITVLFKPNADYTENREFPAVAYIINDGKKSPVKKFFIKMLPPMKKTLNPKNFYVHLWANYDISVANNKLFKDILTRFEEAGMIGRSLHNWGRKQLIEQDELTRTRGWKIHFILGGNFMKKALRTVLKRDPAATNYKGKKLGHICPSLLISAAGQSAIKQFFTEQAKLKKLQAGDMVIFDYEPWQSHSWCFCPECRSRFSKFANFNKVLSVAEIRKDFAAKWTEFRLRDTNEITYKLAQMVKSYNPALKVADYDYPINFTQPGFESRFKSIPKDTRESDKYLDAHFSSFYYTLDKKAFELVDINRQELNKAFFMLPLLTRYTDPTQSHTRGAKCSLSPKRIRLTILNCATAGGSGQSLWTGAKIDGQYFLAIDRAMYEIALLEDTLAQGIRVDKQVTVKLSSKSKTPTADNFGLRALKFKDSYLLCMFNYDPQQKITATLKFTPNDGDKWLVRNPITKKSYPAPTAEEYWTTAELGNGIKAIILPEDVKFIEITPR